MGKKPERQDGGYYEIRRGSLPVTIITGNVIYNALHWHDHVEIIYCMRGAFSVRVEERVFRMAAGDLLLINGQDSHEIFDGVRDGLQVIASIDENVLRNPGTRYACRTVGDEPPFIAKDMVRGNARDSIKHAMSEKTCNSAECMAAGGKMDKADERAVVMRKLLGKLAYYTTPDWNLMAERLARGGKGLSHGKMELSWDEQERLERGAYGGMFVSDGDWYGYLACCYRLLQVISGFQTQERRPDEGGKNEDFRRCISYIHEHYREDLSVGKLARVMNVSEPSVYRVFQNKLAVTPTSYVHIVRTRMACALLKDPARKVTDVALECGFASLSNFYRTFEMQMKMSPREYRKGYTRTGAKRSPSRDALAVDELAVDELAGDALAGRPLVPYQNIMAANIFQNFFELPYEKGVFVETEHFA